ncbi:hypothetical protein L1887_00011 [Cichorium endivia]|nr:hypothetical protein L1887_00011 [Cichorium endivia]
MTHPLNHLKLTLINYCITRRWVVTNEWSWLGPLGPWSKRQFSNRALYNPSLKNYELTSFKQVNHLVL